jgi:hypothetical protein
LIGGTDLKKINLGIGFATGRKSFRRVLATHLTLWKASLALLPDKVDVHLSLFVAYDVAYHHTQSTDFTNLSQEIVDSFDRIVFVGAKNTLISVEFLKENGQISDRELKSVFASGYAGKRNAVLFAALEAHMDYLLFLDDDEYPMAVTHNHDIALWSGQRVFLSHLTAIAKADFTNGCHCGYISPIPQIDFNHTLPEQTFRRFIEAISNDIINWNNVKSLIRTGGVTYASVRTLEKQTPVEVPLHKGCRFISGANLCINLTDRSRVLPFFNPPGARGEDTFLSTLLKNRRVIRIPCYTFHDGFAHYKRLLQGALPIHLASITAASPLVRNRFLAACTGWLKYKPLLIYLTEPSYFNKYMADISCNLHDTLPAIADYFQDERFLALSATFEKFQRHAPRHAQLFQLAQDSWKKLLTVMP